MDESNQSKKCPLCSHPMECFLKGGALSSLRWVWSCLCGHEEAVEDKNLPPGTYHKKFGEE